MWGMWRGCLGMIGEGCLMREFSIIKRSISRRYRPYPVLLRWIMENVRKSKGFSGSLLGYLKV